MKNSRIHTAASFRVLGLMSGTSLDGLDLAGCTFDDKNGHSIDFFKTIPYDANMRNRLERAHTLSGLELITLENDYSQFVAEAVRVWLDHHAFKPRLIGAHGHTVFHQPERGITHQMLNGGLLASALNLPVVCDFRRGDVALGGQGAPLVPIGDRLLFGEYGACLNLGGFANISYEAGGNRVAFDICAANIVLNALANRLGQDFDNAGSLARSGRIIEPLAEKLTALPYYSLQPPKSLGREWVEAQINPLLKTAGNRIPDLLHTYTLHIAECIAAALEILPKGDTVLVTGGGAFNTFLIESLRGKCANPIHLPEKSLIEGKEALIFAFLAKLRWEGRANVLGSVTGSNKDHVAGASYLGNAKLTN